MVQKTQADHANEPESHLPEVSHYLSLLEHKTGMHSLRKGPICGGIPAPARGWRNGCPLHKCRRTLAVMVLRLCKFRRICCPSGRKALRRSGASNWGKLGGLRALYIQADSGLCCANHTFQKSFMRKKRPVIMRKFTFDELRELAERHDFS